MAGRAAALVALDGPARAKVLRLVEATQPRCKHKMGTTGAGFMDWRADGGFVGFRRSWLPPAGVLP